MNTSLSTQASPLPPMEFSSEGEAAWLRAKAQAKADRFAGDIVDLAENWACMIQDDLLDTTGCFARLMRAARSAFGHPSAPRTFSDVDVWEVLERADVNRVYPNTYQFEGVVRLLGNCWTYGPELLALCKATNFHRPARVV